MEEVESKNYKGYRILIVPDENPLSPREEMDNLGTMVAFHRRYDLGDKTDIKSEDFRGWDEMENYLRKKKNAAVVLPLWLLDHSGLWMRTHPFAEDPGGWDSGRVGFIYITAGKMRKEYGNNWKQHLDDAREVLEGEVGTYSDYLSGAVYGWVIEKNGKTLESVWGFYGDTDYVMKDAMSQVDSYKPAPRRVAAKPRKRTARSTPSGLGGMR